MTGRDCIIKHLRTEIAALESRVGHQNRLLSSLREQLHAHEGATGDERRTQIFRRAAIDMVSIDGQREFADLIHDDVPARDLSDALVALGSRLDHKFAEIKALNEITAGSTPACSSTRCSTTCSTISRRSSPTTASAWR